jgi:hypothetical protein
MVNFAGFDWCVTLVQSHIPCSQVGSTVAIMNAILADAVEFASVCNELVLACCKHNAVHYFPYPVSDHWVSHGAEDVVESLNYSRASVSSLFVFVNSCYF